MTPDDRARLRAARKLLEHVQHGRVLFSEVGPAVVALIGIVLEGQSQR